MSVVLYPSGGEYARKSSRPHVEGRSDRGGDLAGGDLVPSDASMMIICRYRRVRPTGPSVAESRSGVDLRHREAGECDACDEPRLARPSTCSATPSHKDRSMVSTTRYVPALRVLRNEQRLAQADLAMTCGVSQATISALETGRKCLSRDLAVRLADVLRCAPDDLLDTSYELVRRVS